jgi:nucleoside-triphosphatase THEP1
MVISHQCITLGRDDFILNIKARNDIEILEVTPGNRDTLAEEILAKLA